MDKKKFFEYSKVLMISSAALTASVGWAGAGDSINVFGIVEVQSKSTNTIVSVPWVHLGEGADRAIQACDLVLTNNLTEGDSLLVYNMDRRYVDQEYTGWALGADGWEPIITVTKDSLAMAPEAENALVKRGKAFWLRRQRPMEGTKAVPFYLCGQYTVNPAESVTIEAGSEEAPAYHLLASPAGVDKCINDYGWQYYNINTNDTITVPLNNVNGTSRLYRYDMEARQWYYTVSSPLGSRKEYNGVINAGTGFWYISRGGRMTVKW